MVATGASCKEERLTRFELSFAISMGAVFQHGETQKASYFGEKVRVRAVPMVRAVPIKCNAMLYGIPQNEASFWSFIGWQGTQTSQFKLGK